MDIFTDLQHELGLKYVSDLHNIDKDLVKYALTKLDVKKYGEYQIKDLENYLDIKVL